MWLTSSVESYSSELEDQRFFGVLRMHVLLPLLFLFFGDVSATPTSTPDLHMREPGSAVVFLRSAFAHGYRHGYEEGYHVGNMDANMNRQPRTHLSQFHGISSRYAPEFGPRKSFEAGFNEGMKAGYGDGFIGRKFRAIDNLRFIAMALDQTPAPADPRNVYFDQGLATGYDQGMAGATKNRSQTELLNMRYVGCAQFHPGRQEDLAAEGSFCDGYRRGFVLGHADGITIAPGFAALSARK